LNRGSLAYVRNFFGGLSSILLGAILGGFGLRLLSNVLTFGGFAYVIVATIGFLFRVGPFSYIGKLYVRGMAEQGARSKQPWEK